MQLRSHYSMLAKILITVGIVLVLLQVGWRYFQARFYRAQLPDTLAVEGLRALHVQNGLLEGCGVVIFDLSPAMAQALQTSGVKALRKASQGRGGWLAGHVQYSAWQNTPYIQHETTERTVLALEDRWLVGLSCGDLDDAWSADIQKALSSPGAYVSTSKGGALIVIPDRRVVILSLIG